MGGIDNLIEAFPVHLKASDVGVLGVIVDADTNCKGHWDALCHSLSVAGHAKTPKAPLPAGIILESPEDTLLPRVGIWIMPNNQLAGMLEDFLAFLVPQESPLWAHVQSSIANIPAGERRFTERAESKALIHTWLAWQEEPGKPLGTSITARYLDPDRPEADAFVDWLSALFFSA